jgi:hypothetical protein
MSDARFSNPTETVVSVCQLAGLSTPPLSNKRLAVANRLRVGVRGRGPNGPHLPIAVPFIPLIPCHSFIQVPFHVPNVLSGMERGMNGTAIGECCPLGLPLS